MYKGLLGIVSLTVLLIGIIVGSVNANVTSREEAVHALKVPLLFIANEGQFDPEVAFYAKPMGLEVFVTKKGEIVYSLTKKEVDSFKQTAFKESLVSKPVLSGKDKQKAVFNYFIGNDRSKWKSNVPTYETIELGEISKGINLKLKVKETNIEKLFYVSPSADVRDLVVKTEGGKVSISEKGELIAKTPLGEITFTKPVAFQEIDGKRVDVKVSYRLQNDGYGFDVDKYDNTKTLIIDPLLASRYVGGSASDVARAIARDGSGNIFIGGDTAGSNTFPKLNNYDCTNCNNNDCTVSKFDSNLNMLASSVIGGNSFDWCDDIVINSSGQVYLIGSSMSSNFPMTGSPYQSTMQGDRDVMIARFSNDIATLQASTYVGGSSWDKGFGGAFDNLGNLYITGETYSTNFPTTTGAYQTSFGGGTFDAFVFRINADLSTLQASTYLGKSGTDYGRGILPVGTGVYLVGSTNSSNFTSGAANTYGTYGGGYDGFIALLNDNLTTLTAARFIGGSGNDYAENVIIFGGYIYVSGYEGSTDFNYSTGKFFGVGGGIDAYLMKMSGALDSIVITAGVGGSGDEQGGMPLAVSDSPTTFYLGGRTSSTNFPATTGAYSTSNAGLSDGFITKFDSNLDLSAATYIGGSSDDYIHGLVLDNVQNVYACGETKSDNFPTTLGSAFGGGTLDQFVLKFDSNLSAATANYKLTVTKAGTGNGTVSVVPPGTSCGEGCSEHPATSEVTLSASPDANSFFAGFSGGGCAGTGDCLVTLNADKYVTATFQSSGSGGVVKLPQTGQTATYDGNLLNRDDGAIRTGQYWPSSRFITGSPNGTVIDKLTGLMWMAAGDNPIIGSCTPSDGLWTDALDYVTCLNNNNYLGFSDWRLPNVHEMASLYHAGVSINADWLNSQGFSNVPTSGAWYWTSTTNTAATASAIAIATDNGSFVSDAKTNTNFTIAVRQSSYSPILSMLPKTGQTTSYDVTRSGEDGDIQAGEPFPNPRFVNDTNTAITIDNLTGLKWPKAADTPAYSTCTGGTKNWQGAIDYINCLNANNYLGYNDWRLPNKNELRSLMFYGSAGPALQSGHPFTGVQSIYWTSTTLHPDMSKAYTVNFSTGLLSNVAKTNSNYILPVRGGLISITVAVTGGGTVKDSDNNINCGSTCSATLQYTGENFVNISFVPNSGKTLTSVTVNGMNLGAVHSLKIRSATHYIDIQAVFSN